MTRTPTPVQDRGAREALDAIRLAIEGADSDKAAFAVIRKILDDGPPAVANDTGSVRRLIDAIQHTPFAHLRVAD